MAAPAYAKGSTTAASCDEETALDHIDGRADPSISLDSSVAGALLPVNGMVEDNDRIDTLRGAIIGCAMEVHRRLGPGLLESIYKSAMAIEIEVAGLKFELNREIPLVYRGRPIGGNLIMDILVEDLIVLELKSVVALAPVHTAQVMTYLKLSDRPAGLLLNFNAFTMTRGIRRVMHPLLYRRSRMSPGVLPSSPPPV